MSKKLTLLEKAKRQNRDAIFQAFVYRVPYTPWSPIDFMGWDNIL